MFSKRRITIYGNILMNYVQRCIWLCPSSIMAVNELWRTIIQFLSPLCIGVGFDCQWTLIQVMVPQKCINGRSPYFWCSLGWFWWNAVGQRQRQRQSVMQSGLVSMECSWISAIFHCFRTTSSQWPSWNLKNPFFILDLLMLRLK